MRNELFLKNKTIFILSCICVAFVVAIVVVMGVVYVSRDQAEDVPETTVADIFVDTPKEDRTVIVNRAHLDHPTVNAMSDEAELAIGPEDVNDIWDDLSDINGVWIASVFNINFPSNNDLSRLELEAELDKIVANAKNAGLTTIFFQVRPESDALYSSGIYPVSKYLSSEGKLTLDALQYIIDAAHSENIAVHAWINPVRVTSNRSIEIEDLADGNPAKKNPEYLVRYGDGKYYYNLGIPEVRELICSGVQEIVSNYAVDGIVFDDYFYPYPTRYTDEETGETKAYEFEDRHTYKQYNEDGLDIEDWRRSNVNKLVEEVYKTVKQIDMDCLLGISPFGIWKNGYGDESGSATAGTQSYSELYCDTLAWVEGNYVDYIAPQLYWTKETSAAPFNHLCDWWSDRIAGSRVRLLISHGAYRYENDIEKPQGIMTEQVEYASDINNYRGSLFYGYGAIEKNVYGVFDELVKMFKDKE